MDLEKKDVRLRDFFARIMLSKSWMLGLSEGVVSRSWMNSLKAITTCQYTEDERGPKCSYLASASA